MVNWPASTLRKTTRARIKASCLESSNCNPGIRFLPMKVGCRSRCNSPRSRKMPIPSHSRQRPRIRRHPNTDHGLGRGQPATGGQRLLSRRAPAMAYNGLSTGELLVSPRTFLRLFTHIQMLPVLESGEETLVGGQAVMEGVMMRAPHSYCVAVRKPNGEIVTEEMPLARMSEKYQIFKYPIFRGVGTLYQAMKLGIKALQFSANAALDDPKHDTGEKRSRRNSPAGPWPARCCFRWPSSSSCTSSCRCFLATRLAKIYPVLAGRVAVQPDGWRHPHRDFPGVPVRAFAHEGHPPRVRVSRRGAQSGLQFRIGPAGDGRKRAEVHHLPSALRHQFPVGGDDDLACWSTR